MKDQPEGYPFITVTSGIAGYFAVMIWRNPELGGFDEPWDTGIGRYKKRERAVIEAQSWVKEGGIPYHE